MATINNKRKLLVGALVILAIGLGVAAPVQAVTSTVTVTVTVLDSGGNPITGVLVQFSQNNFGNYVTATTNASGVATQNLASGTWQFKANYQNTSAVQTQDISVNPNLTFYTSKSIAKVESCNGTPTPIQGVAIKFSNSSGFGNYISATTNASGLAECQLFPGTIWIMATVNRTSQTLSQAPLAGDGKTPGQSTTTTFNPTKVVINGATAVQQWIGYWDSPLASPFYMFPTSPATVHLRFNYNNNIVLDLAISGCSMEKSLVHIKLVSSTGGGLAGGTVYYFAGGGSYPSLPGATDANGDLYALIDGSGNREWHMTFAYLSTAKQQNASPGPVVFQTKLVKVELRDSSGTLEDTGTNVTYWGAGADRTFGSGSTSGGTVTMELLPMNIQFNMTYLFTRGVVGPQNVSTAPVVTFKTGKVVSASNTCTTYWMSGALRAFTNSMELFPANYEFHFSGPPVVQNISIAAGITNNIP
jgi:hypothetical protein